jgi:hypothetical protein
LGAGVYLNYARNLLDVQVMNASVKGTIDKKTITGSLETALSK